MSSKGTQFLAGLLLGGLASGVAWYVSAPKREELAALTESNSELEAEVTRAKELKESYEKFKKEAENQESRIAELIRLLPLEGERSRVNQMIQRLAQNAGLGRMQESKASDKPIKTQYYSEFETLYKYLCGYHEFGRFLSYVSGLEKIVNVSDFSVSRNTARGTTWPITVDFKLSVFVYDHKADQAAGQARQGEGQT